MKRQRQQHSQQRQRSSLASTPLFIVAALTIPTLLGAFAPNAVVLNKRSMQHQSAQDLQLQHLTQAAQSPPLINTPLSFLVRTSATTSKSKLFARGPGRPSAASLEEEDDGDLDFEDEEDAEEVEGKRRRVLTHVMCPSF